MTIDTSIAIAGSGLRGITQGLAVTSQNIANASTPSYAVETSTLSSATTGGQGLGVTIAPATIDVDQALQNAVFEQNAAVAGQQTTSDALTQVDATQGVVASGNDLSSQVGALENSFTTLGGDPSNAANQQNVVITAQTLATSINTLANAYQSGRQTAQDSIVSDVGTLNTALAQVGALSKQIVTAQGLGQSTADLQNQRSAAESTATQIAGVSFLPQSNGDVVALVGGNQVDLQASTGPFAIDNATLAAADNGPALTLNGRDVTSSVTTGTIGANLTLRDTTFPAGQAGIDELAETLATRLANQGLTLFSDSAGNIPPSTGVPAQSGYIGFANTIQVNPAVVASPSLVRDGTNTVAAGTGGAAGFTPNPAGGPTGFSTLIENLLAYGFGAESQAGVAQTVPNATGLGVNGNISLNYETSNVIGGFAANLVGAQATTVNAASTALATGTSLQTTLQAKLEAGSGVSIDQELSNLIVLQNAYGANAKVLTAAQSLWSDLFAAVTAVQ